MLTKRKKKIILITVVTLCVAAVIVAAVSLYVYFSHKEVMTYGVPYKEIVENTTIPTKSYSNLDLSKAVLNVPEHGEFYQYYINGLDYERCTKEETAKIARDIFPKAFDLDPDKLVFGSEEGEPWSDDNEESWQEDFASRYFEVTYSDIEYKHDGTYSEPYGCVTVAQDSRFDVVYDLRYINNDVKEVTENINLSKGEQLPDNSYKMADGKQLSMNDALKLSDSSLERVKEYLPVDAQLQPSDFFVLKCEHVPFVKDENGNVTVGEPIEFYMYQIDYEYLIDGIPSADSTSLTFDFMSSLVRAATSKLTVDICTCDNVNRIHQLNAFAIDGMEQEPLKDEYLTLESACDLLSDFLAPEFMQYIDEITVKYARTWDCTVSNTGKKLYMRPYWCFLKEDGYNTTYMEGGEKQLLVDMQTGDVFALVGDVYVSTIKPQNDKTIYEQQMDAQAPPGFFDDEE